MSGGVDSSVAALLLKQQGHEVIGAFLKLWSGADGKDPCWIEDRQEALRAAAHIGIPLVTIDGEAAFRDQVVRDMVRGYADGETPNPDVRCNELLKFPLLLREADRLGCDAIATGHYARSINGKLFRGVDEEKDQSYFLYRLDSSDLRRIMFPVGHLTKSEVRARAREASLPNADRRSTRGICFVGQVKMRDFLSEHGVRAPGLSLTVGQRINGQFVVEKNATTATVALADRPVEVSGVSLRDVHWITAPQSLNVRARLRHRQPLQDCRLPATSYKLQAVEFDEPQRGVAPGQSIVFYDGDECLGGGIIV